MLAQVAAATAVRRAAVAPGPPVPPLAAPRADDRRECVPAAVDRWHHLVASWPALEDEWTIVLIGQGWRLAAELVPHVLRRHRGDPVRHARARLAGGPSADWLIEQNSDLASTKTATVDPAVLLELPDLPIPADLIDFLPDAASRADDIGRAMAVGIEQGDLAHPHRAVLVNLLCRIDPGALSSIEESLDRVDRSSSGAGLASVLADLALTRRRMLDELSGGSSPGPRSE